MSSAGYHFGARSEAWGMVRDSPFLAPPICFVVGADIEAWRLIVRAVAEVEYRR
jgi:hypothetical protein